jgi:hypothetical protein
MRFLSLLKKDKYIAICYSLYSYEFYFKKLVKREIGKK